MLRQLLAHRLFPRFFPRFFRRLFKDWRALAVFAGSRWIDAVGGGGFNGLVLHWLRWLVLGSSLGLLLDRLGDGRVSGEVFCLLNRSPRLHRLCVSPIVGAGVLTVFGAGIRAAVAGEGLAREGLATA